MAILTSFLCWNNTRTGSAVCAYYSLVISVVCVSFYVFRYLALGVIETAVEYKGIVYPGLVLYTVMIAVSLIMLPGVYMDKKFLLLPWVYTIVVTVLYETGAIALLTTVHLSKDKTLKGWEISSLCFYCFRLLANCYCFACVVSQYQELNEGRGTYDYLYKPRRRRRLTPPLADGDVYHPPHGAHLPPYSEVNVHKTYSPPDYDKLSVAAVECDNPAFSTETSATLHCQTLPPASFRHLGLPTGSGHMQTLAAPCFSSSSPSPSSSSSSSSPASSPDDVSGGGHPGVGERHRREEDGGGGGGGGGVQYCHSAEVHHSTPKHDVYRATYVTWI